MNGGRARILSAATLGAGLLISFSVAPAAAETCALSAPATAVVGAPLAIMGSGFPASASIDVTIGLEGATPDEFAVQSDGAGTLQISLTPEPADAGKTTVVATAGTTCSAQAVFTVIGAAPAPSQETTAPPSGSDSNGTGTPPRTDAATSSINRTTDTPPIGVIFALTMILLGVSGLLLTRRGAR